MSDLIAGYRRHLGAWASPETIQPRIAVLGALAATLPDGLDHPTVAELEAWLARYTGWTRYTYYWHLKGFYQWAYDGGHLSRNPMDRLVRPGHPTCEPRPASEEQLAIALAELWPPIRTAVVLAAFAGLRSAEVARAKREHITREWIPVVRKGGKEQLLPTHERIWAEIEHLPAGAVVPRATGGHHRPAKLSAAVSAALTRIGLADLTLHRFRHRFATIALLPREFGGAGADIRTVQELMGHASLASTQIYTLVTSKQRRAAIAALPCPGRTSDI